MTSAGATAAAMCCAFSKSVSDELAQASASQHTDYTRAMCTLKAVRYHIGKADSFTDVELIDGRPINDNDVVDAQRWMQIAGLNSVSITTAHNAVMRIAADNEFHQCGIISRP
jgi:hypothetical protein